MSIGAPKLTDLQETLLDGHLNRTFPVVKDIVRPAFRPYNLYMSLGYSGIEGEILRRANEMRRDFHRTMPALRILDVGCGSGRAIEECARVMPQLIEDVCFRSVAIEAIGVDINPVPELIDPDFLQSNGGSELVADIHCDDAVTLSTVDSDSVDIIYSIHCLDYVDDALRALEAGWRVLKPGGVMVYHVTYSAISDPLFSEILKNTPGGEQVFSMVTYSSIFVDFPDPNLVVARKVEGAEFKGFPYRYVGDSWECGETDISSNYGFIKLGKYRKT